MNIRQMRTLVAVVERGSFAAASNVVGRSPSAISLQMKTLEEEMGALLFDRMMRPPVPTAQARALADHARKVLALVDATGDVLAGQAIKGTLIVGAVPTVLGSFLPSALGRLKASHPDLRIDIHSGASSTLADQARSGKLDVVICTKPYQPIQGLDWHFIQDENFVVIAPQETMGNDTELLTTHPFIWFNRKTWAGSGIEAELKARKITVNSTMEIDSLEAIAAMVREGLGVAIVPVCRGSSGSWRGLRSVPFGTPPYTRPIGALIPSGTTLDPMTRAFLAAL